MKPVKRFWSVPRQADPQGAVRSTILGERGNAFHCARQLIKDEFLQFNLVARVVDINPDQPAIQIIVKNDPSEISLLSELGRSDKSIYSESVSG